MPARNHPMVGPGGIRPVTARWVITGELILDSAAHLGNGAAGTTADMVLIRDRATNSPLLTGASLAGGLRSHILDRLDGYAKEESTTPIIAALFGGARRNNEGGQSPLIVFDSIGSLPEGWVPEIRDGVAIQACTGLAEHHKKFDLEILPCGTRFPVRFELLVTDTKTEEDQVSLLAATLGGLEKGEIPIGARRSRGLGACHVVNWQVKRFGLVTAPEWLAWLCSDHLQPVPQNTPAVQSIERAIMSDCPEITLQNQPDNRTCIRIRANLALDSGLLVRSPGISADDADMTHLSSGGKAILPGTSLAGALRARALRIARVVRNDNDDADLWVDALFGPRLEGTTQPDFRPSASRLKVTENPVIQSTQLRPSRIRIDRFTGGVVEGALFDEEPIYGGQVQVSMELRQPQLGETGLLLLLLKDLLTGDLPVGGTSAVGRGVLKGTATIMIDTKQYFLDPDAKADSQTVQALNRHVQAFHEAERIEKNEKKMP